MPNQKSSREYFAVGIALKNIHDQVLLIQDSTEHGGKWRLPCDRLSEGDNLPRSLSSAASVIGTKLTSYDFDEHGICHIGLCEGPCVVIVYSADCPYDVSLTDTPDPKKVAAVGWFTYDDILELSEHGQLRDPNFTLAAAMNAQQGLTVPSDLITI